MESEIARLRRDLAELKEKKIARLRRELAELKEKIEVGARSAGNELQPYQVRAVLLALLACVDALAFEIQKRDEL